MFRAAADNELRAGRGNWRDYSQFALARFSHTNRVEGLKKRGVLNKNLADYQVGDENENTKS